MRPVTTAIVLLCVGGLTACESTQDKSEKLGEQNAPVAQQKGIAVAKQTGDVRVVDTATLQDENGTAAVVTVKSKARKPLQNLPIAIDVTGAGGKSVFRNDQPGLEPSLAHVQLVEPRREFVWVNDQVLAAGKVKSVSAKVGPGEPVPGKLPEVDLSGLELEEDPVSGTALVGTAANRSQVEQRKLAIYAVGRKGKRVVAAGKGQIKRLKPGKRGRFTVFFIGNPKGAKLTATAPPTVLQ